MVYLRQGYSNQNDYSIVKVRDPINPNSIERFNLKNVIFLRYI